MLTKHILFVYITQGVRGDTKLCNTTEEPCMRRVSTPCTPFTTGWPEQWPPHCRPAPAGRCGLCRSWRAECALATPPRSWWLPAWPGSGWSVPRSKSRECQHDKYASGCCNNHLLDGTASKTLHSMHLVSIYKGARWRHCNNLKVTLLFLIEMY